MKRIPSNEIPILPMKDIINGESVAFGIGEIGVMVQYMDRDECILIDWYDIISFGIELIKVTSNHDAHKEPEEIPAPTVIDQ
jgi:hypothetical protein